MSDFEMIFCIVIIISCFAYCYVAIGEYIVKHKYDDFFEDIRDEIGPYVFCLFFWIFFVFFINVGTFAYFSHFVIDNYKFLKSRDSLVLVRKTKLSFQIEKSPYRKHVTFWLLDRKNNYIQPLSKEDLEYFLKSSRELLMRDFQE